MASQYARASVVTVKVGFPIYICIYNDRWELESVIM